MFEMLWWVSYLCSDEPDIIETYSLQSWASFNILGEFDFSDEKLQATIGVLPPKSRSKSSLKIGRCEIDDIFAVSIGYRKSYGRFGNFEPLGSEWGGPMILKGIMNVEDAKISIDMVIETIVMSNHGGDHSLNSAGSSNYW